MSRRTEMSRKSRACRKMKMSRKSEMSRVIEMRSMSTDLQIATEIIKASVTVPNLIHGVRFLTDPQVVLVLIIWCVTSISE
jgi:hypothetical protein